MKRFLALLALVPALVFAWEPVKPVTVIVGNTPGAGNEIAFRKLAEIVQKNNPKFTYVVLNIPGADSVVCNNRFTEADADGHTINLPSHMSSYVTNDIWEKKVKKYEWDTFVDVLTMGKSPLVLVAASNSDVNTPQEFVRRIQTTNKPINVAVGGGAHRTAYEYLIEKGFDSKMGARPLQRTIDDMIKKPLSKEILFGRLKNGGMVSIDLVENKLVLNIVEILPGHFIWITNIINVIVSGPVVIMSAECMTKFIEY